MALVVKEICDFNLQREIVYSVDVYPNPTLPWILIASYSEDHNTAYVRSFDHETLDVLENFPIYPVHLRVWCAKWFRNRPWIVFGDEFGSLSFVDYVNRSNCKIDLAHGGRVHSVDTHPTGNLVISSSVDNYIKVWGLRGAEWVLIQQIEGHADSVMQVVFNRTDANTFASVSRDRCMKIWNIDSEEPNFSCTHMGGVNCVAYITAGFLITGLADGTAKVWQETGQLVHSLDGRHSVSTVSYHPELGVIITGSEEGALIWDATTFSPIKTRDLARNVLTVSSIGSKRWVIGGKSGAVLVKLTRRPVTLMDKRSRFFWYKNGEIQLHNSVEAQEVEDGGNINITMKGVIACGVIPRDLKLSPDEGFLAVCDGDRFVILRRGVNNTLIYSGSALEFVWLSESKFAVKESTSLICFYALSRKERWLLADTHKVEQIHSIETPVFVEHIFGGPLFSYCSNEDVYFYDWTEFTGIERIDVHVKHLYWAERGDIVAIVSDNSFSLYKYNHGIVELQYRGGRRVKSGIWVGDLFIYIDSSGKLNCCGQCGVNELELAHWVRPMYLVGNHTTQNGEYVYLIDQEFNVIGYNLLPPSLSAYKRQEMGKTEMLASIPLHLHNISARFLERHGMVEQALDVAKDRDYRFELAKKSGKLDAAKVTAAKELKEKNFEELVRQSAMSEIALELLLKERNDLSGLFELYKALGDARGLRETATRARRLGQIKVACYILCELGEYEECHELLRESNLTLEADMMARAYNLQPGAQEPPPDTNDEGGDLVPQQMLEDDTGDGVPVPVDDYVFGVPVPVDGYVVGLPVDYYVVGVPVPVDDIDTGQGDALP